MWHASWTMHNLYKYYQNISRHEDMRKLWNSQSAFSTSNKVKYLQRKKARFIMDWSLPTITNYFQSYGRKEARVVILARDTPSWPNLHLSQILHNINWNILYEWKVQVCISQKAKKQELLLKFIHTLFWALFKTLPVTGILKIRGRCGAHNHCNPSVNK